MEPYQERVEEERAQLFGRIEKLSSFLLTPLFGKLAPEEQDRLLQQQTAMQKYLDILDARIGAFT